jgi:hypothetical protein
MIGKDIKDRNKEDLKYFKSRQAFKSKLNIKKTEIE